MKMKMKIIEKIETELKKEIKMIAVKELERWLKTLEKDDFVFIDDGGLTVCSLGDRNAYIEVGGDPVETERENV